MSYLSPEQLDELGVQAGRSVRISVDARIFGGERLQIGDNVRIDAFCLLSTGATGSIRLGSHIHIASGARLFGEGRIKLGNFSTVSSGSTIYSASDDFSGEHMISPMVDSRWTSVESGPVILGTYSALCAHSLVLPNVTIGEGAVLGAMGMANQDMDPWTIYVGAPCRALKLRQRGLIDSAMEFLKTWPDHLGQTP